MACKAYIDDSWGPDTPASFQGYCTLLHLAPLPMFWKQTWLTPSAPHRRQNTLSLSIFVTIDHILQDLTLQTNFPLNFPCAGANAIYRCKTLAEWCLYNFPLEILACANLHLPKFILLSESVLFSTKLLKFVPVFNGYIPPNFRFLIHTSRPAFISSKKGRVYWLL